MQPFGVKFKEAGVETAKFLECINYLSRNFRLFYENKYKDKIEWILLLKTEDDNTVKFVKIRSSKYKPPKLVTQKTLR